MQYMLHHSVYSNKMLEMQRCYRRVGAAPQRDKVLCLTVAQNGIQGKGIGVALYEYREFTSGLRTLNLHVSTDGYLDRGNLVSFLEKMCRIETITEANQS